MKPFFSDEVVNLLNLLLEKDPAKRLGSGSYDAQDIMKHPFFSTINWGLLALKEVEPLFKPLVKSEDDYKNFDPVFLNEEAKDTPSDPIFYDESSCFKDFTYNESKDLSNHKG